MIRWIFIIFFFYSEIDFHESLSSERKSLDSILWTIWWFIIVHREFEKLQVIISIGIKALALPEGQIIECG